MARVRKNTIKCVFEDRNNRPTPLEIHRWIGAELKLNKDQIMAIQLNNGENAVYIKLISVVLYENLLARHEGVKVFRLSNGSSTNVTITAADTSTKRVRVFNLPPEVNNERLARVMSTYGLVKDIRDEKWSDPYEFADVMVLDWLPLDWVTAVILALSLSYVYLVWNYDHWKKRGIVYEKPQLFFGNYKDVAFTKKAVGTLMHEIYNKEDGQPYIGLFRFRNPALLVRDPEIIKSILVKDFPYFNKNGFAVDPELDPLFSRSPFFMMGERWKQFRTLLSPGFTTGKLKTIFPLMEKTAKDLDTYLQTQALNKPDGIETKELCCKYTTDVVASCAFGIEAGCFQDTKSEFREMNRKMLNQDTLTNIRILLTIFFPKLSSLLKIRFMPVEVADFYRGIVKDVMTYRENNKETRNDFIQMLMQIKQKAQAALEEKANGLAYSDEDATAHAVTFITEGFETSSITMSFLLYELAMNPDAQGKLRKELEEAVEKSDGKLTYDIIHLPYLDMVFSETLRMHPPLMTMEKFCTKRYELPKKSGGTMNVEPGTLILIPVHAIQHDPKYYPEPDRFNPERFSDEGKESIPKYTYLPFGEGPRLCIGMRFAQLQVKIGVAQVVLNYDIRPTARTPKTIVQDPNYFLAAAEGGLWLNFVRRH